MRIIILASITCWLFAVGLFAQTNRVEGQVYVTRRDRETVKLSLVTVRLVHITNSSVAQSNILAGRAAERNESEWRERANALAAAMPHMVKSNRVIALRTYNQLRDQLITNAPLAKLGKKSVYEAMSQFQWSEVQSTQTDADGNFGFALPPGPIDRWQLVAFAKRKMLGSGESGDEEYVWLVPVASEHGKILLNNSNLLGQ